MKKTDWASPFLYWSPQMRSHSATVVTPFPPTHSQDERSIAQIDEEGVHAVEEPVINSDLIRIISTSWRDSTWGENTAEITYTGSCITEISDNVVAIILRVILNHFFLIGHLYLNGVWLGEDRRIFFFIRGLNRHNIKTHFFFFIEAGLQLQISNNQCTLNRGHNWEDLGNQLKNQHTHPKTITKSREVDFQSDYRRCFIVDFPMQHKCSCVNPIFRSWRTSITDRITPTNLTCTW